MGLWQVDPGTGSLTLANSVTYTTWGRPSIATHNGHGDLGFRFLYVGEFGVAWDDMLGLDLHHMGARHYSPALGRFLQPDPDRSEANLYAYAANNPVTEIDPDGTCFIVCAVLNAVADTAIYLATTDSKQWSLAGAAGAAAAGAVSGFLGVGLLSKVTKVGSLAKVLTKVPKANRTVSRAAGCARHSFDGETLVTLADGAQVPIATLAVGDLVLAWDELTDTLGSYPITHLWVHDDPVTGFVVIDGEAIAVTPGHPFFTTERGWVEAADLRVGERIPSVSGEPGLVSALSWSRGPDTMYDLTVDVAHTYFVGDGGWLVHNCGGAAAKKVHGNSLASDRPTTLYKLVDTKTGEILKYGISSNPARRYTKAQMQGKDMKRITSGSRREMHTLERLYVSTRGGPLNLEPWSSYRR
jgi:RHS repeat-associated protein